MTRKKLLDDILGHPARIYRTPADVARDRRFNDAQRLEILRAWRQTPAPADITEIDAMIGALELRLYSASDHAAE